MGGSIASTTSVGPYSRSQRSIEFWFGVARSQFHCVKYKGKVTVLQDDVWTTQEPKSREFQLRELGVTLDWKMLATSGSFTNSGRFASVFPKSKVWA